jgi:DNA (cytosine-5)-methyltransferase 1
MKSIELFAGAGGLALGSAKAGFEHDVVLDWDAYSCDTLRRNVNSKIRYAKDWRVVKCDVRRYDFKQHLGDIECIFGGPPCQPFSLGGKHRGKEDVRNMFPEDSGSSGKSESVFFILEKSKSFH